MLGIEVFLLRSHNQAVVNTPDTKTMQEYVIKQSKSLEAKNKVFNSKTGIKIYRMIGCYVQP